MIVLYNLVIGILIMLSSEKVTVLAANISRSRRREHYTLNARFNVCVWCDRHGLIRIDLLTISCVTDRGLVPV